METPTKDRECEKQLLAGSEHDEFVKKNIKSEFAAWRRKIKPLYEVLGQKPNDTLFDKLIMTDPLDDEMLSEHASNELISACKASYDHLSHQVQTKKMEAQTLWDELQSLWTELEENEEFGLGFTNAETGIISALHDLKAQYISRKEDKCRRLREYIYELRREMSDIWDQCMITEEEKKQFVEYESCDFTEHMLHIHKEELKRWKIYHEKNQEILKKIHKRETMWKKLRELEIKASDPSRFVNRGGSLLKDQNMHNYLMKNLPKLETELVSLAQQFEAEHGKKMTILGQEIPLMIKKEWDAFNEEKLGRKARTAPSPLKPALQAIRRSIAPSSASNVQPQIRPLEKRFGSKIELGAIPATKKPKLQPLKAIQDD